jgi:hypothetical protein
VAQIAATDAISNHVCSAEIWSSPAGDAGWGYCPVIALRVSATTSFGDA